MIFKEVVRVERRTRYALLFICIAMLNFTASCTYSKDAGDSELTQTHIQEKKIKLRFISSWGGVDSKADTLRQILDEFGEDYTEAEVINESMFGEDFLPKIKTDFASGNEQDVFGLWPGSDIRSLVKAGKVADITDLLESEREWKGSFEESNWSYTTYEGRTYGVPLEIIYEGFFVNKDLFEKYGVKLPETYDELKAAVAEFKVHDIIPIAYNTLAEGTYLYQNIIAMLGGKEAVENPYSRGTINSCYIEAVDYVKELYQLGAFPKDAFTMTSRDRNNLFKNKKAAMITQGSWFVGDLKDMQSSVDIIPFPRLEKNGAGRDVLIYGLGNGTFYMSRKAWEDPAKKELSIKLLKKLTSQESALAFVNQCGMISNVKLPEDKMNYSKLAMKGLELIKSSREMIGPPDSFVDRTVWEEYIAKRFPYVLEGRETAQTLWDEAVKRTRNF